MTCMREKSVDDIQKAATDLNGILAGLDRTDVLTLLLDPYQAVKDHNMVRTDPFNIFTQQK